MSIVLAPFQTHIQGKSSAENALKFRKNAHRYVWLQKSANFVHYVYKWCGKKTRYLARH